MRLLTECHRKPHCSDLRQHALKILSRERRTFNCETILRMSFNSMLLQFNLSRDILYIINKIINFKIFPIFFSVTTITVLLSKIIAKAFKFNQLIRNDNIWHVTDINLSCNAFFVSPSSFSLFFLSRN